MEAENILEIKNLSVSFNVYGKTTKVIDGVSLAVPEGERVGLVGESGCGKTTVLKAVLNVLPGNAIVRSGEIYFKGKDALKMSAAETEQFRRRGAGMIFQDPSSALNPVFDIGTQFTAALKFAQPGLKPPELRGLIRQALTDVSLADPERIVKSYPFQLSGGMKQRVCIAMTIAAVRDLLLADEPGTALDVTIQDQILRLINRLVSEKNLSVIMVSHSLGVVREVTNYVNIMYAGTIIERGRTKTVFSRQAHPYTRALMNCLPKLTGEGIAYGIPGRIPDYSNPPPGCRFAPRCDLAKEICDKEKPVIRNIGKDHCVACHFAEEA